MPNSKSVTIRDVARRAGVSPATVSRFTNGTLELPKETAGRIRDAIFELDYRPNLLARNLSLGRTGTLGLVVPDIANPFFAQLASAAEREAAANGYQLLLCSTESDPDKEITYLQHLRDKGLDGIVFLTEYPSREHLSELVADTANLVLVDEDVPGSKVSKVFSDNGRGGYLATRHLIELGHRTIAHIGGPPTLMTAKERRQGYEEALREFGLPVRNDLLYAGPYRQLTGRTGLRALLQLREGPTAVFAASDYTAIGVLREAREIGLRVPEDLSIVGFDGIEIGAMLSPSLSSVAQPIEELGQKGVRILMEILGGDQRPARTHRLGVELVTRGSVAAPPLTT